MTQRRHSLWPGFHPESTPFVVYDGQETTLWNASPNSQGWTARGSGWVFPGRHPDVVANSATRMDGQTWAASLLLDSLTGPGDPTRLAALAVHEAFHVYQQQRNPPAWTADELDAFTYPATDVEVLTSRAMETQALARALLARGDGWAREAALALAWRGARFVRLAPEHVRFERATERVEGLTHHVELCFMDALPALPDEDSPAGEIRRRAYATGAAYALLLDRAGSDWKLRLPGEGLGLDELLGQAGVGHATVLPSSAAVRGWAMGASAQALKLKRQAAREFELRVGPRLTLRSTLPLLLRGFDPLNMTLLEGGVVLHRRFVRFGNVAVEGEVLGEMCLTGSGALSVM